MKLSDGEIIPGNATAGQQEISKRISKFYTPYHNAIEVQIARAKAQSIVPTIVSIHSFTPSWRGNERPWQVGVLWSKKDSRLARHLLKSLQNEGYLVKALKEYKSGKREHEMMNTMAKNLSDQDMALVAAYFSGIAITVKAP